MRREPEIPEMLTVQEARAALKMSRSTLYRRRFRYVKDAGRRLYYAADIRLYLALNTVAP